MIPNRRRRDGLLIACALLGLVSAIVVGIYIGPVLLDTTARTSDVERLSKENKKRIGDIARLSHSNAALTRRIVRESRRRRDQSCKQDERAHLTDVKRLRSTYRFLRQYPHSELVPAIVRSLPGLERDARIDKAAPFCDEPGIGLPEPDPVLPKRRDFSRLLHP